MVLQTSQLEQKARQLLGDRGVSVVDIANLVMHLQKKYLPDLTLEECVDSVNSVLTKREVHNAILTGIQLDILAEEDKLLQPLQEIVTEDEGLYGIDEILALSIVNVYGSIGFTNYGYIDKVKPGILAELNSHEGPRVHTFLDDIVGAIAASAASRLAHQYPDRAQDITQ
ncbi:phosphatidylglycerophosphatase A family protein [Enterococcus saccharolyticus]|uniref:Phosphatidylglycerophosphatase A n=1 Tax=Enterococcus saccharolyticus subsp. saccharolyticus ATCC 43076 TaxID=1139996 RepID=S0N4M1_9ENTE|nr:phosphatidylglycerophosphatase A [Enterococcus saccharolyticus]EOT26277.1 phosphatidylglycerophosphatase A [Enterococcus saccharolyticus subsp. saccharolyticus ATCC 43076]EOT76237.1 phosphatidylglycerophosphatase A [Enterococcus saccharolyticus subsp. saccharolyticus ATCC 43076]OJG85376.1 phosphatidylglycerophosphatase A [Enterococcus saccharolyticus]